MYILISVYKNVYRCLLYMTFAWFESLNYTSVSEVSAGSTFTACPEDASVGDGSWAGLAFVPGQPYLVCLSHVSNFTNGKLRTYLNII